METLDTSAAVVPSVPGYATSRQLGHGSTSTVWLVTRAADGARFAVKCPRGDSQGGAHLTESRILEEVSREVRLLAGLEHQHLVRIHDVVPLADSSAGTWGIVMDFAAGGSLANLMSGRGSLSVGETVTLLTPLAQALEYLHANGTVHGDVSPGNVLLTAEGKPQLADLGIAAVVGGPHYAFEAGTPGFMPPVRAADGIGDDLSKELQPQRDVYSLGALGWYCLTGSAPETTQHRPPLSVLVPGVPKSLVAALEAALELDPLLRPTARELGTAIFRSAAPEPLDLSGAVHSSVIPELLTRRQAMDRPRGSTTRWARWWRRFLPVKRQLSLQKEDHSHRRRGGWFTSGAVVLTAGLLLGVVGWTVWQPTQHAPEALQQAGAETKEPSPEPATDPALSAGLPEELTRGLRSEDPAVAVAALSALRDMALGRGRLELLAVVNAPGSPAEAADQRLADHLRGAGTAFSGFSTTLSAVRVTGSATADDVLVAVTATTSSYEERDGSGAVVLTEGAGAAQELRVHMVRPNDRWLISGILAPDAAD
ncbi:protein kinase domain-containing protein [Paenarthrobacter sp. TE4293]|uniref:protein kinase domain-containing protein n=1 Tax=Paenarthrobacter sp. TE4293 TaxID=3381695 RepID=UPI003D1B6E15